MTRSIQIAIEAQEVVDFLTGRRALALPEGVHVRNFSRNVETNPETGAAGPSEAGSNPARRVLSAAGGRA